MVARGWAEEENRELLSYWNRVSVGTDEKVLGTESVMFTQQRERTPCH